MPLHLAAANGWSRTVEVLLKARSSVDAVDGKGVSNLSLFSITTFSLVLSLQICCLYFVKFPISFSSQLARLIFCVHMIWTAIQFLLFLLLLFYIKSHFAVLNEPCFDCY